MHLPPLHPALIHDTRLVKGGEGASGLPVNHAAEAVEDVRARRLRDAMPYPDIDTAGVKGLRGADCIVACFCH